MSARGVKTWQIDAAAIGVCLLLGAAVYFVGLKPIIDRQALRVQHQNRLAEARRESQKLTTDLNTSRATLAQIRLKIKDSAIQLQSTRHLNQRLSEITKLATECGLQVDEIQPGSVSTGERYETVPISLAGAGKYEACATFLHRLQKAFPDTGVSAFELVGHPRQTLRAADFQFSLIWYAAPTPSLSKAADEPTS